MTLKLNLNWIGISMTKEKRWEYYWKKKIIRRPFKGTKIKDQKQTFKEMKYLNNKIDIAPISRSVNQRGDVIICNRTFK